MEAGRNSSPNSGSTVFQGGYSAAIVLNRRKYHFGKPPNIVEENQL